MTLVSDFERLSLPLEHDFTIARGTARVAEYVVVRIGDGEHVGVGGAAPSSRYGERVDTVEALLPELLSVVESIGDPHTIDRIERRLDDVDADHPSARAAVSIALHDLACKRLDLPLYAYWGLDPTETIETSYTIGIDEPARVREKTEEALERGFEALKVKVGTEGDRDLVRTVREAAPKARIRVDANEAWSPEAAVDRIADLAALDVEFVEQPVPADDPAGLRYVFERSALPIVADESCVTSDDVPRVADRCDGVNLKLMKCGGLREALRSIRLAREHDLSVMLGCMVESNASIAAACHLTPMVDYADLDGALLLAEDPYDGIPTPGGRIVLDDDAYAGTGARPHRGGAGDHRLQR